MLWKSKRTPFWAGFSLTNCWGLVVIAGPLFIREKICECGLVATGWEVGVNVRNGSNDCGMVGLVL